MKRIFVIESFRTAMSCSAVTVLTFLSLSLASFDSFVNGVVLPLAQHSALMEVFSSLSQPTKTTTRTSLLTF